MILGHIGARGGSKGVPGKNFRVLCGKPLIDWSLDLLLSNPRMGAVVVSTDDPAIHAHAIARGTLDIGLRPAELATDAAPKWGVWQHALQAVETVSGQAVTAFVDLDCTFPLRLADDLNAALDAFEAARPDMLMTVCEAETNPYFNLLETDEQGSLQVCKPLPGGVWSRQAAPKVWEHAGTYILQPDYLRRARTLFEGHVIPYELPAERAIDIDTPLDFRVVEWLMQERLKTSTPG